MPFNPRTWFGKPNTTTPIDAANLNRIEAGIKDAHDALSDKANAQAVADALATKLSGTEADTRYAPVSPTTGITYNSDGSVATVTENGVTTTYTYNSDGTVATDVRAGVTRTYTYDGSGNLTGIAS